MSRLSVVIPVYNEPEWIAATVRDAEIAIAASPFDAEIIVVDDGSDAPTGQALERIQAAVAVRVLRQPNLGRYEARRTGLLASTGDYVLLLDSRVSLSPTSLAFLAAELRPGFEVWNGHCMIDTEAGVYARFWQVLTVAAFGAYHRDPRAVRFGLEEYDRFPKGTGHFFAPREYLVEAIDAFESRYSSTRHASDDTALIRHVAAREPINLSPGFDSLYRSRTSLLPFLEQALHRGTTLVDGFGRRGDRFFPAVAAAPLLSLGGAAVAAKRPRLGLLVLLGLSITAGAVAAALKRPLREIVAFATLVPPFSVAYAAGIWRGLWLSLRAAR